MVTYDKGTYHALYGNINPNTMAGPRDKCMSQCTGCKCSCSSKCKNAMDKSDITDNEWEAL